MSLLLNKKQPHPWCSSRHGSSSSNHRGRLGFLFLCWRYAVPVFVLIWMMILVYLYSLVDQSNLPQPQQQSREQQAVLRVRLPNNNKNHPHPLISADDEHGDVKHPPKAASLLPSLTSRFLQQSPVRPSANYVVDPLDLWEEPQEDVSGNDHQKQLPDWIKDYFRWHKEQTTTLLRKKQQQPSQESQSAVENTTLSLSTTKFLVLTCPPGSRKCGGLVDRLSPLLFLVFICSKTQRLLLIHWGRPAPLQEFLLPPVHGIGWQYHEHVYPPLFTADPSSSVIATTLEGLLESTLQQEPAITVVRCRYQAPDHGAAFFDTHQQQSQQSTGTTSSTSMAQLTRTVWNIFFTPAPPVAQRIQQVLRQHNLQPQQYYATHIRALYAVQDQDPYVVQYWTRNAVNCTTQLAVAEETVANRPIQKTNQLFVASDASFAFKYARLYGQQHGWSISLHSPDVKDGKEPLHLDKASHWQQRPPSDYYDAFVDLYLLGLARCVTYGVGGYGKFASWLTGNHIACGGHSRLQHHNATGMQECNLALPPPPPKKEASVGTPLFPPPIKRQRDSPQRHLTDDHGEKKSAYAVVVADIKPAGRTTDTLISPKAVNFPNIRQNPPLENLWDGSTILPKWMKDYFVWHREQRRLVSEMNWNNFRFLVVECSAMGGKCGGTSDRLRPIPFYVRLAAETKRILFIHWGRPQPLETFLMPPVGGMDWRTPEWLVRQLAKKTYNAVQVLTEAATRSDVLIQARIQAHDHGSHYYDNSTAVLEGEGPLAFRRHFHDCWYVLFTPVPKIAQAIETELRETGLVPGHFGVAHIRALYGIETLGRDLKIIGQWTRNAINCLSNLRGGPYFVASDSDEARRVAVAYGQQRNVHIVARTAASTPIHMDIADANHDVTSMCDVFIDLYLMSFGRCLSYNVGGFGKWAQLLSGHDFTCNIQHWTRGVPKQFANKNGCEWNPTATHEEENITSLQYIPLFLPPMN